MSENDNATGQPATPPVEPNATFETLEAWLAEQPDEQRALITPLVEKRLQPLENTVKATRQERDALAGELKKLTKKLGENSDAAQQLNEFAEKLEGANRKAEFFETSAGLPNGKKCSNPRAAYAVMVSGNLYTKTGQPDWSAIEEEAPELFAQPTTPTPRSNAGNGARTPPEKKQSISDYIRAEANRKNIGVRNGL